MISAPVLTEAFVVESVCRELGRQGWSTTPVAKTSDRGIDIVATRDGVRLSVEAKGAGSSREGSKRFGSEFNSGQVTVSVGMAVLKALQALSAGDRAGIAFPDNAAFRTKVSTISEVLESVAVAVFWVADDGTAEIENGQQSGVTASDSSGLPGADAALPELLEFALSYNAYEGGVRPGQSRASGGSCAFSPGG